MLIGDSYPKHVFICGAILGLRLIAPASIAYCVLCPIFRPRIFFHWPLSLVTAWALAESSFFLLVYLRLKSGLQREAKHPEPPPENERRVLFQRCLDTITEPGLYLSRWFLGASPAEIKRENVKEFYAWSFMNKTCQDLNYAEDTELDEYVDGIEDKLDYRLEPGRGSALGLRGTIEAVYVQHRPLIWYIIVGFVDVCSSARLLANGYRFQRESLSRTFLNMVPARPLSFLGNISQPGPKVSYWYQEHTRRDRLPVLFIHGVGIGMYAYMSFLVQLKKSLTSSDNEGDVGIIVLEILPVSARICSPALAADDMRNEVDKILQKHGWQEFVLVGHSYGTAIAASIVRDPGFHDRVKAAVLMDPICFLLHLPDVAYNFTRRKPSKASETMLYYFSSRDMMISHTFARRFFWSQVILWKEDVEQIPLTVTLSGRDIIVPTNAVWCYLTNASAQVSNGDGGAPDGGQTKDWSGDLLKVLWFGEYNHADLFDSKGAIRAMVRAIQQYSAYQFDN